ncbi:hypothetical protein D8B22_00130 [Verminephrobacter aporrectodeae subsp. tuberculatae]|uniref:hypothetical protein n=1 Tax=Verminephrobacter aporrectodeae TaxID=1110389 RepID=UPI0002376C60|nr:hypothetical protein [Verminephrobacter aporrectodeae]MCW8163356.1 hypothetical protein [Verminephrobacter aporrectodeae subsp. tuberculatae]MCW8167585.1 hypothetical protein [Verminephrobacter aporrectodeae subsp. tuberculatae]
MAISLCAMVALLRALAINCAKGSRTLSGHGDIAHGNTLAAMRSTSASCALISSFFGLALSCASRRCFLVRHLGTQNVQQAPLADLAIQALLLAAQFLFRRPPGRDISSISASRFARRFRKEQSKAHVCCCPCAK